MPAQVRVFKEGKTYAFSPFLPVKRTVMNSIASKPTKPADIPQKVPASSDKYTRARLQPHVDAEAALPQRKQMHRIELIPDGVLFTSPKHTCSTHNQNWTNSPKLSLALLER